MQPSILDTPFGLLCHCLSVEGRGDDELLRRVTAPGADWPRLLRLAGGHLVTPALAHALRRRHVIDRIDPELRDYLEGIEALNLIHNDILRSELFTMAVELNAIGITPLLIKGAISLLPDQPPASFHRVMTDLDIVIPEDGLPDAEDLLASMGYGADPLAWRWLTEAEKRTAHHLPRMQHCSRPVAVELHRRMLHNPADDAALRGGATLQAVTLPGGARVLIPDPVSRLVHGFIHSQISHNLRRLRRASLRHLLEFACLAEQHRASMTAASIGARLQPRRLTEVAEYWRLAEVLLGAPYPSDLPRSPREARETWLTAKAMTHPSWRRGLEWWCFLAQLPQRSVGFCLRAWETPPYLAAYLKRHLPWP